MKNILGISLLATLIGCSSTDHKHIHDGGEHHHSHEIVFEDQLSDFERKDYNSFLCLTQGQFQNRVSISEKNGFRYIKTNNIPNHKTGQFPGRGNPHTIKEQDKTYQITLKPKFAAKPTKSFPNAFGVALNGVFFEPSTAEFWQGNRNWNEEAISSTGRKNLGLDDNYAHVQPDGSYHYHGVPTGLVKSLEADNKGKMMRIGYAADGFPIYSQFGYSSAKDMKSRLKKLKSSYQLKKGKRPAGAPAGRYDGTYTADYEYVKGSGDLDEFNGRFGLTPEYPKGTYYYIITDSFPFMSRSWKGTPDKSFFKRRGQGGPPGRGRPPRRGDGPPPRF